MMATMTIEKRLSALEMTHLNRSLSLEVRFTTGEPTDAQRDEHAALRAAGVALLTVTFVPSLKEPANA